MKRYISRYYIIEIFLNILRHSDVKEEDTLKNDAELLFTNNDRVFFTNFDVMLY